MKKPPRLLGLAVLVVLSSCSSSDGTGPVTVTVNGAVLDYFTGSGVTDASVAVAGASHLSATTSAGGSYNMQGVPSSEALVLITSKTGYRPTRNFAVSATGGMGVVFVELVDATGAPRTGVPLADVTLVDGTMSPAGVGPFFFGAAGDIVPQMDLTQSAEFGGRARAAFLNVPVGTHILRVALGVQTVVAQVVVVTGGATLVER